METFKPLNFYRKQQNSTYKLLPFRFANFIDDRKVLTNMVGEHLFLAADELNAFVSKTLPTDSRTYKDLKSKHFLYDDDSSVAFDLLALKTKTKYEGLSNFTGLHIFVVTLRCEHSCPYCQVSRQSDDKVSYDMSYETALRSLDLVFKSPAPAIKIEFQGGESLLNFELIKDIVLEAQQRNQVERKHLEFVVATNLAPITDEMLEFFNEHKVLVSTSLDGPEILHNKNRPRPGNNSYELTVNGIKKCREKLGKDRVGALMTTTKESLGQVQDIIDEYVRLEFDGIFLRALSPYGFAVKTKWYSSYDTSAWLDFYKAGLDYIIELNKQGVFFVEQYAATILAKILTPFDSRFVDLMNPAGIGIAGVVYNYDGNVYASDESRMLAEMGDNKFKLGNVHSNSYEEIFTSDNLLDALEESFTLSSPMCTDCAYEPFCGSDPVYHYRTQSDLMGHKPTSGFCERNMSIIKLLLQKLESDAETRRILYSWVPM